MIDLPHDVDHLGHDRDHRACYHTLQAVPCLVLRGKALFAHGVPGLQHIGQVRPGVCRRNCNFHRRTGVDLSAHIALRQNLRRLFAERIFDQCALERLLLLLRLFRPWQKGCRLNIDQPCRHFQELSGKLQILFPALVEIRQVLLQQTGDLDVVNIQLVLGNQTEEQVHRSFKDFQLKRDLLHGVTSPSVPAYRSTGSPR
jgi:hypothetical protein